MSRDEAEAGAGRDHAAPGDEAAWRADPLPRPDDEAERPAAPGQPEHRRARRWLAIAGVLHAVAMLLIMSALVRLGPLTLTFSVAGGGFLLAAACAIYLATVVSDLRRRRVL